MLSRQGEAHTDVFGSTPLERRGRQQPHAVLPLGKLAYHELPGLQDPWVNMLNGPGWWGSWGTSILNDPTG